jgi:hypothetical protein
MAGLYIFLRSRRSPKAYNTMIAVSIPRPGHAPGKISLIRDDGGRGQGMKRLGSWRTAQRAVDIALRFDTQVALLLHERCYRRVGLHVRLAPAQLARTATALRRFFSFDYFRHVALGQRHTGLSDHI